MHVARNIVVPSHKHFAVETTINNLYFFLLSNTSLLNIIILSAVQQYFHGRVTSATKMQIMSNGF